MVQCANPPRLEITDEAAIPAGYKTLTIKVPAVAFEEFIQAAFPGDAERFLASVLQTDVSVNRTGIKRASGPVEGTEVVQDYRVERR
jgi:hypothetical protein